MKKILIILSVVLCSISASAFDKIKPTAIPEEHPDYAVVYFYRTGGYVQTPYDVHLGNEKVYRSKNKTKVAIKVDQPGTYEVWGKTETRESLMLHIEMGKEYYVKTFVHFGAVIWRPSLELMPRESALPEWNSIR